jgi:hypothetical protein
VALFTFKTPDILVQTTNLKEAFFNKGATNRLMKGQSVLEQCKGRKLIWKAIPATAKPS